jgi:hypothetical protein
MKVAKVRNMGPPRLVATARHRAKALRLTRAATSANLHIDTDSENDADEA